MWLLGLNKYISCRPVSPGIRHVQQQHSVQMQEAVFPQQKVVYSSVLPVYLFYTKTEAVYLKFTFLYTIFYILKNSIVKYTWLSTSQV